MASRTEHRTHDEVSSYRRHPVIDGALECQFRNGGAGRLVPASPFHPCRLGRYPMPDLLFILLIVVAFALLALVVRGVVKL